MIRELFLCIMYYSDDSSTESDDLSAAKLVKELINLRREIRRRDELHKKELQKVKEEFSAALTEVRHDLQAPTDRPPAPHKMSRFYRDGLSAGCDSVAS